MRHYGSIAARYLKKQGRADRVLSICKEWRESKKYMSSSVVARRKGIPHRRNNKSVKQRGTCGELWVVLCGCNMGDTEIEGRPEH